jgi:hypothetical protein
MTPKEAYCKCKGKKNKKLEPYIIKSPQFAFYYAKAVIKGRWIEAEKYIIKSPYYAYFYAQDVMKGRWKEAEEYIINDSECAYYYALFVIKGKLPENMHNAMLIYADDYAKEYLDVIKNPQP